RPMSEPTNPVLVEVPRGGIVESRHRGAACVYDSTGARVLAWGEVERPIFPRSSIKLFQAVPFLETGAADICQANFNELALACASHGGERAHVAVGRAWVGRIGRQARHLARGARFPLQGGGTDARIAARDAPTTPPNK